MTSSRCPVYALSHGGGPWPWMDDAMGVDWGPLARSLQAIPGEIGRTPTAILCVTAHWYEAEFTVQTNPAPGMLYDYFGFPPHTYHISYPAPGSPQVAERVVDLLSAAGFPVRRDADRGFDHGTFVPLAVAFPDAQVPVVQMSIKRSFDAAEHLAAGRALAALRDEDVLIVGSGLPSFHDLSRLGPPSQQPSVQFDGWLTETIVGNVGQARSARLAKWQSAPSARACHPMPDHLLPVMVAVGAAEDDPGALQYHEDRFMGWTASSGYRLG